MNQILRPLLSFLIFLLIFIACSKEDPSPQKISYTLTTISSPTDSGTISPSSATYEEGQSITLTATPIANFEFKNWTGAITGTDNPIMVIMDEDKTVTAVFEELPPLYKNGEGIIGALGGTVMIEDENSPINGVFINIPAGAIENQENIKISLATDVKFSFDESLPMIKLEPDGLTFSKPIEIGLPYDKNITNTENLTAINFIPGIEGIIELDKIKIDIDKNLVIANTNHFSYYTAWNNEMFTSIEMLKIDGKIGARLFISDIANGINGFEKIVTTEFFNTMTSISNAWQVLMNHDFFDYAISTFTIELYEYGDLKSELIQSRDMSIISFYYGEEGIYITEIEDSNKSEFIFGSPGLILDESQGMKFSFDNWMSGKPLIFTFNDFQPDEEKTYFLKFKYWLGLDFSGDYDKRITPIMEFNFKPDRQSYSEMTNYLNDSNNNGIDDDFE